MPSSSKNKPSRHPLNSDNLFKDFVLYPDTLEHTAPIIIQPLNEPNLKKRLEADISTAINKSSMISAENDTYYAAKGAIMSTLAGEKTSEFLGIDRGLRTKKRVKDAIKLGQKTQKINTQMLEEVKKYIMNSDDPFDINKFNKAAEILYKRHQGEVVSYIKKSTFNASKKYDEKIKTQLDKAKKKVEKDDKSKVVIDDRKYDGTEAVKILAQRHIATIDRVHSNHASLSKHAVEMERYKIENPLPKPIRVKTVTEPPVMSKEKDKTKTTSLSTLIKRLTGNIRRSSSVNEHDSLQPRDKSNTKSQDKSVPQR